MSFEGVLSIVRTILILIAVVITGVVVVVAIQTIQKLIRGARGIVRDARALKTVMTVVGQEADKPAPKSVSGATAIYLRQIERDFPDYHAPDAKQDVKNGTREYLEVRYAGKAINEVSGLDKDFLSRVEKQSGNVSNLTFNQIAISGYKKTDAYATVTYQLSVGFWLNGVEQQVRYRAEYTLRLTKNEIATEAMKCPNCGAPIEDTATLLCPYCDVKIIRDTILSWRITDINEI